ncbi:MAG: DMT family transporter [Spirochaetia bacterium]|nr:DMT family transporter [Spirochaetia bacterium]
MRAAGDTVLSEKMIIIGAVAACTLWASAFLGGKYALGHITPLHLGGIRLIIAGALLMLLLRRNPFTGMRGRLRWVFLLSFLQTIFVFSAFNLGLNRVPGSFGAIIIGCSPAVSSVIAVIFIPEEHLTLRKVIGLLIGILGITILGLSRAPWTVGGKRELLGAALLMGCNISTALGNVVLKKRLSDLPSLQLNTLQILIGAVAVMSLARIFEPAQMIVVTPALVFSMVYLAFVTAAAVTIWMVIIRQPQVKVSSVAMWKFLIPTLGPILSWIFIPGDSPSLIMIAGMTAVAAAILFTVSDPKLPASDRQKRHSDAIIPSVGESE